MAILDSLREFTADMRSQRLRTTLTVLGITWGTVAVVVLLAFGVGLENQTRKRFHGLGDRIVILFGGRTTEAYAGFREGRWIQLRAEDATLLQSEIADITMISPEYNDRTTPVRRGRSSSTPNITGINPVYGIMRNVIPDMGGRFINQRDVDDRRRVIFLGDEIAGLLFEDDDPVGNDVFVGEVPFTVIGVMRPKLQSSSYSGRDKDRVFIPASTYEALFGDVYVNNFVYRTRDAQLTKAVERRVYEVLGSKYRFNPEDEDALAVWDTSEFEKLFGYMFLGFKIFFGIVGGFTLTVGGIGVANIMYIVVRERTREIGVKRSVGARRSDIMRQFLAETFFVVAIGAVFGFLASVGLVKLMSLVPMQDFVGTPTISSTVMVITVVLLGLVGIMAGIFPARKAANLDPVECLRY